MVSVHSAIGTGKLSQLAVLLTLARVFRPPGQRHAIGDSQKVSAVRALHERLRDTIAPVELWGVKVPSRSLGPQETALLSSFLRAREWSVDDAETMFKESLLWRREYGVARLRAAQFGEFPSEVFRGRDRDGHLVVVLRLGELDGACFDDMERFIRWRVYMQELLNARLDFGAGPAYTLILNCEGFSTGHFGKAARRCAKELSRVSQSYYPDFLAKIIVCNPPPIFTLAYSLLRPFLPHNFVQLIQVCNADEASCLEQISGARQGKRRRLRRGMARAARIIPAS